MAELPLFQFQSATSLQAAPPQIISCSQKCIIAVCSLQLIKGSILLSATSLGTSQPHHLLNNDCIIAFCSSKTPKPSLMRVVIKTILLHLKKNVANLSSKIKASECEISQNKQALAPVLFSHEIQPEKR